MESAKLSFVLAKQSGDGVGVGFFVECFRCSAVWRSGSKTFLIFEPNDSSAAWAASLSAEQDHKNQKPFHNRRCAVECPLSSAENRVRDQSRMR